MPDIEGKNFKLKRRMASSEESDFSSENPAPTKKTKINGAGNDEIQSSTEIKQILQSLSGPELENFLDIVEKKIGPSLENLPYNSAYNKLDWTKVEFKDLNSNQCKALWGLIQSHQRKFRTLREMIADSKVWVTSKRNVKKPTPSYLVFFQNEFKKMKDEDPKINCITATKIISARYKAISPHKKAKMQDEYKAQMAAFHEEHPEHMSKKAQKSLSSKDLPRSPFKVFADEIAAQCSNDEPRLSQTILRERWNSLEDFNKVFYIQLSKQEYIEKCVNEDGTIKGKSPVSKDEEKLYLHAMGVPTKPPSNGFSMYVQEFMNSTEGAHLKSIERVGLASKKWKEMREEEHKQYSARHKEKKMQYELDYQAFMDKLSDLELSSFKNFQILPWKDITAEPREVHDNVETELNNTDDDFPDTPRKFFQLKTGQKKKAWKSLDEEEKQNWIHKYEKKKKKHEKKKSSAAFASQEIDFTLEPPLYNSTPMVPQNNLVHGKKRLL